MGLCCTDQPKVAAFVFGTILSSFMSSGDAAAIFAEVSDLDARLEEEVNILVFIKSGPKGTENKEKRRRHNLRSDVRLWRVVATPPSGQVTLVTFGH